MDVSFIPRVVFHDRRTADLGVVDFTNLPFVPKRVYWMTGFKNGATRGNHAHKTLRQLFVLLSGEISITISDGNCSRRFDLNETSDHLLIEPGYWRVISDASHNSNLMVLADQVYEETDYIRDWSDFLHWKSRNR